MTATISRLDAKRAVPELYRPMIGLDRAVSASGLDPHSSARSSSSA